MPKNNELGKINNHKKKIRVWVSVHLSKGFYWNFQVLLLLYINNRLIALSNEKLILHWEVKNMSFNSYDN